jgi:hypothetical protein
MKAFGRQIMARRILTLCCCLPFFVGGILGAARAGADELDEAFSSLKDSFETQARQNQAPAQLAILGLETTARAWALAAAGLTEDPEARAEWQSRSGQWPSPGRETDGQFDDGPLDDQPDEHFDDQPDSQPDPVKGGSGPAALPGLEERQSAALELYYQAFREAVLYLVAVNQQKQLALEMRRIHGLTRDKLDRLTNQPQREMEKRVILSGALVGLATVAVRSLGGNLLSPQVEDLVRQWLARSESLSRRSDLHYRAKLQLMYIDNLRRLTALIFVLGRQAGPPLSRELALLHGNLNLYGPKRGLPEAQSLIWAAQAQAAIPLAYWLIHQGPSLPPEP